jgi:hypothetical protein
MHTYFKKIPNIQQIFGVKFLYAIMFFILIEVLQNQLQYHFKVNFNITSNKLQLLQSQLQCHFKQSSITSNKKKTVIDLLNLTLLILG